MGLRSFVRPIIKAAADPALAYAVQCGRSFWQVRYRDGHVVNEWDRGADWPLIEQRHQGSPIIQVRLLCPNWQVGVLGNSVDASDRLFQFKIGSVDLALAVDDVREVRGAGRTVRAHLIGMLNGTNGEATCYAWEWPGRLKGPFEDRYPGMSYGGPVTNMLNQAVLGAKAD